MYTLNGFVNVTPLAINVKGVVSPIGEISTRSLTYSREVGQYALPAYKDVTLVTFLSSEGDDLVVVPDAVRDQVLKISQWLWDRAVAGASSNDRDEILSDLLTQFQTEANTFDCGEVIKTTDGRFALPEWLNWKNVAQDAGDNFIKIYFADQSFQNQYDKTFVKPVFTFLPVDNFFLAPAVVIAAIKARTNAMRADMLETAKEGFPETIQWGDSFDYVSPLDGSKTPADFEALIYGAAGNNIDTIKDAITTEILKESTHTRDEWVKILPDLFKRTEVILTPIWDKLAIPDSNQVSGIYSPVTLLSRAMSVVKQTAIGYAAYHVEQYAELTGHPYKSLAMTAIGGPENRDDKFRLSQFFPDYINVGATTNDFSRMGKYTTDWLYMLAEMMLVAESMTAYSDIPRGMTRLTREGIMYVVKSYDKTQYLVAAKNNFVS